MEQFDGAAAIGVPSYDPALIAGGSTREDRQFDFRTDNVISSAVSVQRLAIQQVRTGNIRLERIEVYLGLLKSFEFTAVGRLRRTAIKTFWIDYFSSAGARCRFFDDGPGVLQLQLSTN